MDVDIDHLSSKIVFTPLASIHYRIVIKNVSSHSSDKCPQCHKLSAN